ncbi:MAG TPA: AAA family ATPase [Azospirillum sp.]|nr:AAA family ATPase [Azospirillum sp.]
MTVVLAITPDHDALREQCLDLAQTITKKAMAEEAGIAYGTFTNWLGGTYQGDNDAVARKVKLWLDNRQQRSQVAQLSVVSPPFQRTPTAVEAQTVCMYAQALKDFGVIVGPPGGGKTWALKDYRKNNPNVWLVTVEPLIKTATAIMQEICTVMGIVEKSATRLPRAISRFTEDKQGLLIVDEAQILDVAALEQLRALNKDGEGLAIVICGNIGILSKLEGLSKSNAQLYSRVGGRKLIDGSTQEDITAILAAWGVTDAGEDRFLRAIAAKPGHLRNIDKCMKRANVLANGQGMPRTVEHLKAAWSNLAPDGSARSN